MALELEVAIPEKQLVDGLSQGGQDAALSQQEAEALKGRFTAAMASLKGARFGDAAGSAALYQLPWYMFIGAPGSGKTTSLLNSGLRLPWDDPIATKQTLWSALSGSRPPPIILVRAIPSPALKAALQDEALRRLWLRQITSPMGLVTRF